MKDGKKMSRENEISKVQTALWMSEKLARLCRETIQAKNSGDHGQIERLVGEIESLVCSEGFVSAVDVVSREYFYPAELRNILYVLQVGEAETAAEAIELMKK